MTTREAEPNTDAAADAQPEPERPKKKKRGFVRQLAELPMLVVFAFVIAIVIKTFLVQAFFIPSG